ncbi:MAG: ABC transporter permease subunit [Clostridia bacterium]|nr:ABC transporter permease subunit [Clostridia bacterium]
MNSIIKKIPKPVRIILVLAFWVGVWWLIARSVNKELLIASPDRVARRLLELAQEKEFYTTVLLSVLRILTGFLAAVFAGVVTGIATAKIGLLDELISPLLSIIKATPVASFIILALVWIDRQSIPSFISFLMVLPIIQGNVSAGLKNTPNELIEMTRVYKLSRWKRITKLYFPTVLPYFTAGCKTSLGLAWKAGVAAEVLCTPKMSIGKQLYESKLYMETVDVFTWTIVVIVISVIIEKLLMWSVGKLSSTRKREADI